MGLCCFNPGGEKNWLDCCKNENVSTRQEGSFIWKAHLLIEDSRINKAGVL